MAWGAQLLQARWPNGQPLLYRSPSPAGAGLPVRGGVPVLFPQFANTGPLGKHGFARHRAWQLVSECTEPGFAAVAYQLLVMPATEPAWPHSARLLLQAELQTQGLLLRLTVENQGASTFQWTGGLHPYWYVDDLTQAQVAGLQLPADVHFLTFDGGPVEQLYPATQPVALQTPGWTLKLQAEGFDEWMVWNPGQQGACQLTDMPAGDWRHFVCIEPVRVSRPVELMPGEVFTGTLKAQFIKVRE